MAQAASVDADRASRQRGREGHPWLTLLAVSLGVIMVMLDGTVVAIANPVIAGTSSASLADLQWVTSGYLLALAVFLITAGKLGDLFGHKRDLPDRRRRLRAHLARHRPVRLDRPG